jgi:hypothetical protein
VPEERVKEAERLKSIDRTVAKLLKNKSRDKDVVKYIQNNRLAGYYVYLKEREMLEPMSNCEALEKNTYERLQKLLNTINHLSAIGNKIHVKFLLIKTLNVLPYLPVYDVDVFAENSEIIEGFEEVSDVYIKSKEVEENKYNFLPKDSRNFFKLSFHMDITWNGVKVKHYNASHWWKNCIEVVPHVGINSPPIEALIRLQECLLERLYITLIDYLFLSNYLQEMKSIEISEKFPKFIRFRNLKYSKGRLLLKNSSRWVIWQIYYLLTGRVPFYEKDSEF